MPGKQVQLISLIRRVLFQNPKRYSSASVPITSTSFPELSQFESDHIFTSHDELYRFSINHPDKFWGTLARSRLQWIEDFGQVMDCDMTSAKISWFLGGKINVSVNCIDRHTEAKPDKVALIWEKDEPGDTELVTYGELQILTSRIANLLKSSNVKKGDRVVIYMPNTPYAVATMLACARIGAVHSVVFLGFSSEALSQRINDAQAEILFTVDQTVRGGKIIPVKNIVDKAVAQCPQIRQVFVALRTGANVKMSKKDAYLEQALYYENTICPPEKMDSEDHLFTLYTSGSTGRPKGVLHSQAGYLLFTSVTHKHVFDVGKGDRFGCVADIGWITGHSYVVYGPLCNGVTTVLYDSTPIYPNPGRYWEMCHRLNLTHFYTTPTAIRLLIKHGDKWARKYKMPSLRVLGTVGEPINIEAWNWYHQNIGKGRCTVIDTWWQTETGGICIAPRPSAPGARIIPGMAMRPVFGIKPVIIDEMNNVSTKGKASGALCIQLPWPGMARSLFDSHQKFIDTYFKQYPGFYFTGDGAIRDEEGYYQITGRLDDVVNISGYRFGTAELEDALTRHPAVAEAAVVEVPDEIKGQHLYAFVVKKESTRRKEKKIIKELQRDIKQQIAAFAVPKTIQLCSNLPKTKSGKIMRRILKKIAKGEFNNLGDTSTIVDPTVLKKLIEGHLKIKKQNK